MHQQIPPSLFFLATGTYLQQSLSTNVHACSMSSGPRSILWNHFYNYQRENNIKIQQTNMRPCTNMSLLEGSRVKVLILNKTCKMWQICLYRLKNSLISISFSTLIQQSITSLELTANRSWYFCTKTSYNVCNMVIHSSDFLDGYSNLLFKFLGIAVYVFLSGLATFISSLARFMTNIHNLLWTWLKIYTYVCTYIMFYPHNSCTFEQRRNSSTR